MNKRQEMINRIFEELESRTGEKVLYIELLGYDHSKPVYQVIFDDYNTSYYFILVYKILINVTHC